MVYLSLSLSVIICLFSECPSALGDASSVTTLLTFYSGPDRQRLLDFLTKSTYYKAEALITRFVDIDGALSNFIRRNHFSQSFDTAIRSRPL